MIGGPSSLATQIDMMNEVLRAFAATDFSAPFAAAERGGAPARAAPGAEPRGVGADGAEPLPETGPLPGTGPRVDPSRSLDGLRPPAAVMAGQPAARGETEGRAEGPPVPSAAGRPAGAERRAEREDAPRRRGGSPPPGSDPPVPTAPARPDGRARRADAVGIVAAVPPRGAEIADAPGRSPPAFSAQAGEPVRLPGSGAAEGPRAAAPADPAAGTATEGPRPVAPEAAGDLPVPAARGALPTSIPGTGTPSAPSIVEAVPVAVPQEAAAPPPSPRSDEATPAYGGAGPARPEEAAAPAAGGRTPEAAHGGSALPVVRREAVAGLDLRFVSEGASAGAASGDGAGAALALATVIFNAAMIPGWPPPRPFDHPAPGEILARALSRPASAEDEAALAGEVAARSGMPGAAAKLQAMLRHLPRARRLRALLGLSALMDTIEAVLEAIEAELLELSRARRDGEDDWAEAGTRRQLTA